MYYLRCFSTIILTRHFVGTKVNFSALRKLSEKLTFRSCTGHCDDNRHMAKRSPIQVRCRLIQWSQEPRMHEPCIRPTVSLITPPEIDPTNCRPEKYNQSRKVDDGWNLSHIVKCIRQWLKFCGSLNIEGNAQSAGTDALVRITRNRITEWQSIFQCLNLPEGVSLSNLP